MTVDSCLHCGVSLGEDHPFVDWLCPERELNRHGYLYVHLRRVTGLKIVEVLKMIEDYRLTEPGAPRWLTPGDTYRKTLKEWDLEISSR